MRSDHGKLPWEVGVLTSWEASRVRSVEASFGRLPIYDSAEWYALGPRDPRRWASVVRAAACWRTDSRLDKIAQRLDEEMARVDRLVLEHVRAASHDVSQATDWSAIAQQPSHTELQRRRR